MAIAIISTIKLTIKTIAMARGNIGIHGVSIATTHSQITLQTRIVVVATSIHIAIH